MSVSLNSATGALSDPVAQTVETIASLHARAEQHVSRHQRIVEFLTALLGRPGFFYVVLLIVSAWIGGNLAARFCGHAPWDAPPFYWLQGLVGLSALLMTIMVLITQNRQAHLAEQRAQLDLQINLLAEQKLSKLIALMEELRRDMPTVRDRHDPEAEAMTEAADPHAVLTALEVSLAHGESIQELAAELTASSDGAAVNYEE